MVIISNGHHKFITGAAAVETYKNNLLAGFVTAGYPIKKLRKFITLCRLDSYPPINRLLKRQEDLPDSLVYSLWLSEIIYSVALYIARRRPRFGAIIDYGLRCYAWQAEPIVRNISAKIYHYRSGYGHGSVRVAKQKEMITLCDHSIVHPAALEYLVENGGKLPPAGQIPAMDKLWSNVLKDLNQADYLLVNSHFVKDTFIHFGYDPSRIFVLYTGVEDQFLSLIPSRSYPTLTQRPLRLLFAGDIGARKGGRVLLQALSLILDLPWQFKAIGSIEPNLRRDFKNFFTDKRVTVVGHLPWAELAEHMSMADIFVFPSLAEGSARVVFMAMACGNYVITTPNSGSIVQDEIHGKIVAPGNVDALVYALRKTLLNRELISTIGRSNADLVKLKYTQSHYGNGLVAIYKKLIAHG